MKTALLALETATDVCGVALFDGGQVLVEYVLRQKQQHARALVPLVEAALQGLPGGWETVGAVAVSAGPGSYTGLRIGVSAAKGFCAARDLPLVAVPTPDALAASLAPLAPDGAVLGAALPSRRGEVYVAWYRVEGGEALPLAPAAALSLAAAALSAPPAPDGLWLVGPGAPALASLLPSARVIPDGALAGPAGWVARLGACRLARGETESVALFEPYYLKNFAPENAPPG